MSITASRGTSTPLIIKLMLERNHLAPDQLDVIRDSQLKDNVTLEEILIREGFAGEGDIAAAYSEHYLIPLYVSDGDRLRIDPALAKLLPEKLCRDHLIAPVALNGNTLDVVFFTPDVLLIADELQLLTGYHVRPLIAPLSIVEGLLTSLYEETDWVAGEYSGGGAAVQQVFERDDDKISTEDNTEELVHLDQQPPPGRDGRIIRYVNQIFEQAFRSGASDIHVEPFEERCRVRLRIDGTLAEIAPPPQSLFTSIVARIKVLSKMDIAEKRLPQDGAIALKSVDKRVDVRVNTVPTVHGEKVVLRVLDRSAIPLELTDLGLDQRQVDDLTESINSPHGLMLVTGPTGSGKSTTLYACLNRLNGQDVNICTVEDPVEYKFNGMNQIQVKTQVGLTFANALRAFLRQDPDIIMVGEVRDSETAQICLRAALTGHFVLSTLHTNDALAAVSRLADMDVEPFLLSSTLRVLVAQRLIRRICKKCRQAYTCDADQAERYGIPAGHTLYRPVGCKDCREKGYRGRVGIFEVIRLSPKLASLIQKRAPLHEMRAAARDDGIKLLRDSAMEKVCEGKTSLEEALSVTISEDG